MDGHLEGVHGRRPHSRLRSVLRATLRLARRLNPRSGAVGRLRIRSTLWVCLLATACGGGDAPEPPAPDATSEGTADSIASAPSPSAATPDEPWWIVFQSARTGDGDLYAVHPDSREIVPVLRDPAPDGTPRWDPARDRIVHMRFVADTALLWADGERLFPDPHGETPPSWSPSGEWITYAADRDGRTDLFLARADGTQARRLTDDDAVEREPAWSPDGRRIVFARTTADGTALWTLDLDEGGMPTRELVPPTAYLGHPAWSPDGTRIAVDMEFAGDAEIAIVDVETSEILRVTDRDGPDLVPAWSPDGTRIAFGADVGGPGGWDVWIATPADGTLDRLTADPAFDGAPVWVPGAVVLRPGR